MSSHTSGWSNGDDNSETANKEDKKFLSSREIKKEEINRVPKEDLVSNITKDHFFEWSYLSEGAIEDIYLVTAEDSVIKIPAGTYGQKKRRMSDGHLIDRHNNWYGPRKLSHEIEEPNKQVLSNMEKVRRLFEIFKTSEYKELKSLGDWWNKQSEEQQCEILEIFAECEDIRRALAGGKSGKSVDIKKGLKISPEKLTELSRREFKPPKLSDILGSSKFVHLSELGNVGWMAGGVIDEWMVDYISGDFENKEKEGGVNFFSLLEKIFKGEQSFKECMNNETSKFYAECSKQVNSKVSGYRKLGKKESLVTPKVSGVVKGGTIEGSSEIRVSVGTEKNKNSEIKRWRDEEKQENNEQAKKYISSFKSSGREGGIIDVKCKRFEQSWLWFLQMGKQAGCEAAWSLIFRGDVDEKRLCLFEIPNGKSYVREYHLSFMKFSYWWNNNKFWSRCSSYGL
ncbi:hypothetical protein [Mycoplasma suis]|uniref:Uncharacterized protein n=1 Tax=Mycoplasma suis (strain Illinois) TaxID=768700 RepID=F0QRG7_MYCSL|nr:hypothetical protein [Mycoplasma suis]ADX98087.1 hypothetical protein MSU_0554 [Mycoplasma suis str. Illinois]